MSGSLLPQLSLARFVDRPNRFVARCDVPGLGRVRAHLPNPGRMWELLFPGVQLWLSAAPRPASGSSRSTGHTVVAVERDGEPVFLHTHSSNEVARRLVDQGRIPALADGRIVRSEVQVGHSRFDFLLERQGAQVLMEVKSVTLFGNGLAMFPDAPTARGRRHLEDLVATAQPGPKPVVLFLVHSRRVDRFLPDYHTDLAFAQTLLRLRPRLDVVAAAIGWRPALGLPRKVRELFIPWRQLAREAQDRGAYLLLLHLSRPRWVHIGRLGRKRFEQGTWIYVGSAMGQLGPRIARHLRTRKRHHWHIDELRAVADHVRALPIRASRRLECAIAADLARITTPGPTGFGSSDCTCPVHLFHHPSSPLDDPAFHQLLQRYRMPPADSGTSRR